MDKEITEVDVIPYGTIVDIPVSGAFYEKLQNCLFALINQKKEEEDEEYIVLILKELETRNPQNLWEEQIIIFLSLIYAIDNKAADKGLTIKQDISKYMPKSSSPEASL